MRLGFEPPTQVPGGVAAVCVCALSIQTPPAQVLDYCCARTPFQSSSHAKLELFSLVRQEAPRREDVEVVGGVKCITV